MSISGSLGACIPWMVKLAPRGYDREDFTLAQEVTATCRSGHKYASTEELCECLLPNHFPTPPSSSFTDLDPSVRIKVLKLSETHITTGVHDLSTGAVSGGNERAFHIVKVISIAVELLVWAVKEDTGVCVRVCMCVCVYV